jgi:signal transduction histidine kinase
VPTERVTATHPEGPLPLAIAATPLADGRGGSAAIVLLRDVRAEVELERMRDDFFFIASHELRTPLTVMKGNLELAQEAAPDGPLRKTIAEALASVLRLIRIVNDYLDAARLDHGTLTVRLEDGFMADLVRQAVETIRPDAERKGLQIAYRESAGLPAVRMDVERTLQILLNLLGNSVRYTSRGHIEVWHEVHDGMVETLVRDTGAGIAPEHHARLFTRFGQVGRGLTRTSGGSGLGLYISRKLAEQMGGSVVLKHSAPGQGSTFALRLPAVP